jgi:thymidylate synthase (FAD)
MAEVTVNRSITFDKFGARPCDSKQSLAETPILDHGRVALLATYGSDQIIAETARVSYGKGTKSTSNEDGLIRYLMRHRHTSPIEHAEVVFFLRVPIFVARQLVRHRTANINEYSARYSELSDDFYVPAVQDISTQSDVNKQGRGKTLPEEIAEQLQWDIATSQQSSLSMYKMLIEEAVSRELSRTVTSVGTYTEMYWKCDLHNFLHFLKLRMDSHAQYEIRVMANAMYECAKPFFPRTCDAWEDYVLNARTLSAMELQQLSELLKTGVYHKHPKMTKREQDDFQALLDDLHVD